ncbi:morphogenesis protein [Bipolaris maydis]|nr:morphogenesis protein [Bipolaris maydis]
MPFFKNVFNSKDKQKSKTAPEPAAPPKPRWEESWTRKEVAPEEIQELVHVCTQEIKSRALDMPFMLLPFRPTSDTSASRNFVRNFFKAAYEETGQFSGEQLAQELRLTAPLTLCSIIKWCWSRLPGGVVTWDAYELFRIGESDSNFARHSFDTFIPMSVDSESRKSIIFDFFDLLSSVAARGKTNGMGGRKLSRLAGWWAFEFHEDNKGFDGGYRTWEKAADAASHLFFAYLRSLSPDTNVVGAISTLPRSLQALLSQTEYPPQVPTLMQTRTTKVVMIVDSVSPTPFALLRRAKHFEYRDGRPSLAEVFRSNVASLTDPTTPDPSWSRFEDFGFAGILDNPGTTNGSSLGGGPSDFSTFGPAARTKNADFGRPTTPSWADFLSSGSCRLWVSIVYTARNPTCATGSKEDDLDPGELASITKFELDENVLFHKTWATWSAQVNRQEAISKEPYNRSTTDTPMSKTSIGPEPARENPGCSCKPHLVNEAGPAMKWGQEFGEAALDRDALRAQYLGDTSAGKGSKNNLHLTANGRTSPMPSNASNRELPPLPKSEKDPDESVTPVPWPDSPIQSPRAPVKSYQTSSGPEKTLSPEETPLPDDKSAQASTTPSQHPALRKAVASQPKDRVSEDKGTVPEKKQSPAKLKKKEGGSESCSVGRRRRQPAAGQSADDSYFPPDAVRSESRVDDRQASARVPSPTYTDEQPEPVRAPSPNLFSIDQGPMEEMPAFVPEDSDEDAAVAPSVPRRPVQQANPRTPTQRAPHEADDVSEESVEFAKQQSPSHDRWAQIRKNAADRAARLSEEQVRRSRSQSQSQRTDEGETSGEETIESRVARIKARVAELTGNVDGQPVASGPGAGRQW